MRWLLIAAAAAGIYMLAPWAPSEEPIPGYAAPAAELEPYRADRATGRHPCIGKRRCVVVYSAPWCPICRYSEQLMVGLHEALLGHPEVGMVVVVGPASGQRGGAREMAQALGIPVRLDPGGAFWRELRGDVAGVPAWFSVDATGEPVESFSGGSRGSSRRHMAEVLRRLELDERVKL